ncbi:hypothetical protein ACFQ4C_30020 [Larkinella insperata]|uniref:Protein argonaute n=1 Tax=Larkinella insperata TaxID=332158 RepID=A0ABW3QL08_9BACT
MAISIELQELSTPFLEFGGVGEFTDPKVGLRDAGPYDMRFGKARINAINVGLVGPLSMIILARQWLSRCQKPITSLMNNIAQYPDFPGFEEVFRVPLNTHAQWEEIIDEKMLNSALFKEPNIAFEESLNLYVDSIRKLLKKENFKPNVVICCLPENLKAVCGSIENKAIKNRTKAKIEVKKVIQLELFAPIPEIEQTQDDLLRRDFRRALKARAMEQSIATQIGTERLFTDQVKGQDAATRAWNSCIALYYKAGGVPWRLRSEGPETCFVGISFYHLYTKREHLIRSCIAQAFSSEGEGFAIRGADIPWDEKQGLNVHLNFEQASDLGKKILAQYQERTGISPMRVVVHKTSSFNTDEADGLRSALSNVAIVELVNLAPTNFRLTRFDSYPPQRGTLCILNSNRYYLFTTGYMPELKTYPGPHIPAPMEIKSDSELDIERIATDVLGLAKMNWNTGSVTGGYPVTLSFSRLVGGIMAEYRGEEPLPSFRYYI